MNNPADRARSVGFHLAITTLVAIALLVFASRRSENRVPDRAEEQIRSVLNDQVESWNRGDLDGFMAGYWNSEELLFCSASTITKGWRPTLERYRQRYQAEGREMGKLTFAEIHVEPIKEDIAIVRGRWLLSLKSSQPHGLFTLKMVRFAQGWRCVYDHTSAAEPQ